MPTTNYNLITLLIINYQFFNIVKIILNHIHHDVALLGMSYAGPTFDIQYYKIFTNSYLLQAKLFNSVRRLPFGGTTVE